MLIISAKQLKYKKLQLQTQGQHLAYILSLY
jgi:hypothetical protein